MLVHRGQILIAIKTEISDSIDTAPSEVEVEPTQTINEVRSPCCLLVITMLVIIIFTVVFIIIIIIIIIMPSISVTSTCLY